MDELKKREDYNLYMLNGVEDYLTESAKKYRRNLLYASSLLLSLAILHHFKMLPSSELSSLFGIKFVTPNGSEESGIKIDIVIAILCIVCLWEMVMFGLSKKVCDSHWVGERLHKEKLVSVSSLEFQEPEIIRSDIERYVQSATNEISLTISDSLKDTLLSHGVDSVFAAYTERQLPRWEGVIDRSPNQQEVTKELKEFVHSHIEQIEKRVKEDVQRILEETKSSTERIEDNLEEWKRAAERMLERNTKASTELISQIKRASLPPHIIYSEYYAPMILGGVAIFVALVATSCFSQIFP